MSTTTYIEELQNYCSNYCCAKYSMYCIRWCLWSQNVQTVMVTQVKKVALDAEQFIHTCIVALAAKTSLIPTTKAELPAKNAANKSLKNLAKLTCIRNCTCVIIVLLSLKTRSLQASAVAAAANRRITRAVHCWRQVQLWIIGCAVVAEQKLTSKSQSLT